METMSKRLRRLREKQRLSIPNIANALGVAQSTYREWEQGRRICGEPYVRLAEIFGVSLSELLGSAVSSTQEIGRDLDEILQIVGRIRQRL